MREMREQLKALCIFLVGLPEYERKQIMSVLLASTLTDLSNEKANEIYEITKEGMDVRYYSKIRRSIEEITSKLN